MIQAEGRDGNPGSANNELELLTNAKISRATMKALPSGTLEIDGVTVTQEGAGTIIADGGPVELLSGAMIIGGTLHIQLAGIGAGEFDKLAVSGAVTLGGTLHVEPIDGFVPQVGQQFIIMTFASRTGEFTSVTGPGIYEVAYANTSVTLKIAAPPIPGDLDGDGNVDINDLNIFAGCMAGPEIQYPTGCDDADLELDGDVDVADFAQLHTLIRSTIRGAGRLAPA